ncbi:MAG: stationary-phase survival protein SurE [Fibrobacteres bacterium]|nr:stationary-phase survival protein SurE [Fibrobacterota bacterium]
MKILITNDDGILSPVLTVLADALSREHQVLVVAPTHDQSGMSQAFTHGLDKRLSFRAEAGSPYPKYQVMGTPCDCVKFAIAHLFKDRPVDLVLSGINLGENAGMSAVYSGTVAAAREGAMWGIPSVAVSVWKNAADHLDYAVAWILKLLREPAVLPIRPGGLWNVNFPPCDPEAIEGTEITAMSTVMFKDTYEAVRTEHGITEFRLVGYKPLEQFQAGTDDYALARNRISITPLQVSQSDSGETRRLAGLQSHWDSL